MNNSLFVSKQFLLCQHQNAPKILIKSHQDCQNMTDDPALDMGVKVEIKASTMMSSI